MLLFEKLFLFSDDVPRGAPEQMALDEALLEFAGGPLLRVYRWEGPAVTFGYSQSLAGIRRGFPALPLVRRWTGGGIVEHGSDWTFALVVPADEPFVKLRPAETYRLIHEMISVVLGTSAISARLTGPEDCRPGDACFAAPSLHDVTAGGRKVCGGAQRRTRRGLLHQGSIQNIIMPENFGAVLSGALSDRVEGFSPPAKLFERAHRLATKKYATEDWNAKTP